MCERASVRARRLSLLNWSKNRLGNGRALSNVNGRDVSPSARRDRRRSGPRAVPSGSRGIDALWLYMREIAGATPTREQEVALSRAIDRATRDAFAQLVAAGVAMPEIDAWLLLAGGEDIGVLLLGEGDDLADQRRALAHAARLERHRRAVETTLVTGKVSARRREELEQRHSFLVHMRARALTRLRLQRAAMEAVAGRAEADPLAVSVLSRRPAAHRAFVEARQRGRATKHQMTRANLRLVVSVARHYTGRGLTLEDLIQEGNIGLMRAVDRFDHRRGTRFATYAVWWIRQALLHSLTELGTTVRIPRHARRMGIGPPGMVSLDPMLDARGQDDFTPFGEGLLSTPSSCEEYRLARELLDMLDQRERRIVELRMGFGGGLPLTLRQAGAAVGLTAERVRQIERDAIAKLRELSSDGAGGSTEEPPALDPDDHAPRS